MSVLTREQVEYLCGNIQDPENLLLNHDASLRARLAEQDADLERVKSQMASEYEMDMNEQLRKARDRDARIARLEAALNIVNKALTSVVKTYVSSDVATRNPAMDKCMSLAMQALAQEEPCQ